MSIGEHRHFWVRFKIYGFVWKKKTYRFCNLRKWKDFNKKQLTLQKMCVTSLLCGPRTDLWPFYGFLCKRFSLCIKKTFIQPFIFLFIFVGYRNDRFFSHTNPYILNVYTQQSRCSPMLIFRAWATCVYTKENREYRCLRRTIFHFNWL